MSHVRHGCLAAPIVVGMLGVTSCAIPNQPTGEPVGQLPNSASFIDNGVSTFMEHRCGGLDCHGQDGRPLRLYSDWGLRRKASKDGARNAGATTNEEKLENYRSVVGLEPENLALCFATKGADFKSFQLLLKPLDIQGQGIRHKGGPVLRATESDPGWNCLYGWASGIPDKSQCEDAAKVQ